MKESPDSVLIRVVVQPSASRTEVVGLYGEPPRLKIRLAAPPVDGAANEELLYFLKKKLKLPLKRISILRGASSKMKDVLCEGADPRLVRELVSS